MPHEASPRRQQMHSCDACRRRKVRCDRGSTDPSAPCSACSKANATCEFTIGWRRKKQHGRKNRSMPSRTIASQGGSMKTSSGESTVPRIPVQTPPELLSPRASTAAPGNATPAPSSEEAVSLGLAKNGLFRFFRDGISSSTWNVFDSCDRMRVVYVGTDVSNMTHLIRLNKPNSSCLVLPFPQIHPPHLWKSSAVQGGIATETVQDVISFPAKDVRDSLVDAYFAAINPFFPVVDEAAFRDRYRTMDSQSPLMLLHAVLLAGAHVSTHPRVVPARYMLKATLFRRAKHLFDMRHENDRVHLVQTALLFTWHLQNGDTASANAYYWTGVACRIAFGIGMHRNLSVASINPHANNMPAEDRRHWRRVWWTLFQVDALSALEHGRPPMIRFEDFDQEPLVMDDFIESNGVLNASLDFDYCTQNIGLCHIILDILALSAPRVSRKSPLAAQASLLNSRLASWMLNLPSSISSETFADLNLRLHYHTAVLHLYRLISDDVACPDRVKREAWSVVGGATSAIVSAFEVIRMRDMVGHCHFTALVALTAAAIHTSKEIQRQLGDSGIMAALNDLHLLDRVCLAAEHLSEYWPNAEGVRKVFRSLLDKFTAIVRSIQEPSDVTLPDASIGSEMTAVNWSDILESSWHQETTWEADACWNTGIF